MSKPDPPRCPLHVAVRMSLVEEIVKTSWAGKKRLVGWRFRCAVPGCPRCEVITKPEPELFRDGG